MEKELRKIAVIIVDDHKLFRMGMKAAFEAGYPDLFVTGVADSGAELFRLLCAKTKADIVLLDINLPDMNGVDVAQRLNSEYPNIKILAVSAESGAETIKKMLDIGIHGFVSKQNCDPEELYKAIQAIMNETEYFGCDIAAIIYRMYVAIKKTTAITPEFTEREKEIILLCREGLQIKEIADRLHISINTVNTHKKNIFEKLGINNTMEMVQYAVKKGIIRG